ncbi:MAG: PP2C family protein-serine/threonine phosphatase [Thermoflexibacteraceae bacterium]
MEHRMKGTYHKVLERQIRKFLGKEAVIPEEYLGLFSAISDTYKQYEDDRLLIEHTMDISSQELSTVNQELLRQKNALEVAYEELRAAQELLQESERIVAMSVELRDAYSLLEKQTEELKLAHVNHHAAIQRAKRIQNALLPTRHQIANSFEEFFVFQQPLDIVSGDFFWYSEMANCQILIVADCTGHGVPGAFMTIMANTLLDEIVNTNLVFSPAKILEMSDKKVTLSLMHGKDSTHDGMDISIVSIDSYQRNLTFAGAKHILYHVRHAILHEIKGSIFPIGGHELTVEKSFSNFVIQYDEHDTFYMTTDGYQSQFSPTKGKFLRKRLRETIMRYHHLPLVQQRPKFKFTFAEWKEDERQTDDILLLGFKVKNS